MSEFLATNPLTISVAEARRSAFPNSRPRYELKPNFHGPFSAELSNARNLGLANDDRSVSAALSSKANGSYGMRGPPRGYGFYNELEFEDKEESNEENSRNLQMNSETRSVPFDGLGLRDDAATATGLEDSVELNSELNSDKGSRKGLREEDLVRIEDDSDGVDLKKDDKFSGKIGFRRIKQVMRRSNLLAKQVISIRSALSLGFVSQLWVDTTSWMVLFVEVRPNLLSGDSEKFLLEDISQVGDVVLVRDESVIENEFKMVGLETLVGYKVVTPSLRNIGKVRGYTFSISSGAVEELELDSFGLSIIPSSLVSTYSLLVEDVLEVVSDAVVVHEAAASRIQRLSKGFLGNQNVGTSLDDVEEYSDSEESVTSGHVSRRRRSYGRKKPNRRNWDTQDDWELPMEYL